MAEKKIPDSKRRRGRTMEDDLRIDPSTPTNSQFKVEIPRPSWTIAYKGGGSKNTLPWRFGSIDRRATK